MIFPADFSLVVSLEQTTRPETGRSYSSPFSRGRKAASSGRNLGTFKSRAAAEKHEHDLQYFKRH
jgi:hypothetical protein